VRGAFSSRLGTMSLCSVAQASISALEASYNLRRISEPWFSIVRSERKRSDAIWRLESPRPTIAANSRSQVVRGSVVSGISVFLPAGALSVGATSSAKAASHAAPRVERAPLPRCAR
jgi:hypothetical protein